MKKYPSGTNPLSPTKPDTTWADLAGGRNILEKQMQNRWVYCFKKNGLIPYSEKQKQKQESK